MTTINYDSILAYPKEVECKHPEIANGQPITLNVQLKGMDGKPDCQFGHFGYNFYFRTPYGVKAKKYTSTQKMEKAVEKVLKNNGFKILRWV